MHFLASPNLPPPPAPRLDIHRDDGPVTWEVAFSPEDPEGDPRLHWSATPSGLLEITDEKYDAKHRIASAKLTRTPAGQGHGAVTVRATWNTSGRTTECVRSRPIWAGYFFRFSHNTLYLAQSPQVTRVATRARVADALVWSPTGECYVLNLDAKVFDVTHQTSPRFWVLDPSKARALPASVGDPAAPGDHGDVVMYPTAGRGNLWTIYGPRWQQFSSVPPVIQPVVDAMIAHDVLVAWAPPEGLVPLPTGDEPLNVTCYLLNVDRLNTITAAGTLSSVPVQVFDPPSHGASKRA